MADKVSVPPEDPFVESFAMVSSSLSALNIYDDNLSDTESEPIMFMDLQSTFPSGHDLFCRYRIIVPSFQHENGDSIALCKYRCSSKTGIIAAVTNLELRKPTEICTVKFSADHLPIDGGIYHFCFFRNDKIVACSPSFNFSRTPDSDDYVEVEDPLDPGLVVFKSKNSQLKEEVAKLTCEKQLLEQKYESRENNIKELQLEIKLLKEEVSNLVLFNDSLIACNEELKKKVSSSLTTHAPVEECPKTESNSEMTIVLNNIEEVKKMVLNVQNILISTEDMKSKEKTPSCTDPSSCAITESTSCSNSLHNKNIDTRLKVIPCAQLFQGSPEIIAMDEQVKKLTEENSFLKSRVEVLELELSNSNEKKYEVLMECLGTYENENCELKKKIEGYQKRDCELEAVKSQCSKLAFENDALKHHFGTNLPVDEMETDEVKNLFSITGLLSKVTEENKALRNEICKLRKECIGKVSVCDTQTEGRSPQAPQLEQNLPNCESKYSGMKNVFVRCTLTKPNSAPTERVFTFPEGLPKSQTFKTNV